jgi:porphobilinogen synthase
MNTFPDLRLSRLRKTAGIRAMFDLEIPAPAKWCWPTFVVPGQNIKEAIASMPGQYRYSPDQLVKAVEKVVKQGIGSVLLFGQTDGHKDNGGSQAWNDHGAVQQAVRLLKQAFPQLTIITDVCLCAYTDHGHCAPLCADGSLDNDAACECLAKVALSHAAAGADIVAPSAMMDGQISVIREALSENDFKQTLLMAYSTKFASACYGPFRDAEGSAPQLRPGMPADRKGYQASYANPRNAIMESVLDEAEGADILMVKPALFYLDMIQTLRQRTLLPVAAYNVSGEYSMLIATARQGWGDLDELVRESTMGIVRAGADLIISYWASEYERFFGKA